MQNLTARRRIDRIPKARFSRRAFSRSMGSSKCQVSVSPASRGTGGAQASCETAGDDRRSGTKRCTRWESFQLGDLRNSQLKKRAGSRMWRAGNKQRQGDSGIFVNRFDFFLLFEIRLSVIVIVVVEVISESVAVLIDVVSVERRIAVDVRVLIVFE